MVAMYTPHVLLNLSGPLGPQEEWSTGCRYIAPAGLIPTQAQLQELCDDTADDFATQWVKAAGHIGATAGLKTIKINAINPDGKYRDPITARHDFQTAIYGPDSPSMPDFNAISLTLGTGYNRGRAHSGRMYPPNYGVPLASASPPKIAAQQQGELGIWLKDLLQIIVDGVGGIQLNLLRPAVCSKIDGTVRPVTEIRVGNVIDVQRRRKNHVTEVYIATPFPPA